MAEFKYDGTNYGVEHGGFSARRLSGAERARIYGDEVSPLVEEMAPMVAYSGLSRVVAENGAQHKIHEPAPEAVTAKTIVDSVVQD